MIAILHADEKWGIGKNNGLMFRLPLDMKFFRETTNGRIVCMGYNTLLSFPESKPLKNRVNIVLCPEKVNPEGVVCVHSLKELSEEISKYNEDDVFIIGGAMFYATMLPFCKKALVTKVKADGGADVFFENLDRSPSWKCLRKSDDFSDNGYVINFTEYENSDVKQFVFTSDIK